MISLKNITSGILIENGKILLIKRNKNNELYYVIPGGGIEVNENIKEATIRELKEETNIDVEILNEKPLYILHDYNRIQYFMLVKRINGVVGIGNGPEYTSDDYISNGTYLPLMVDLKDIVNGNINLRPIEFKNELVNIIKKFDINLLNSVDIINSKNRM